MANGSLYVNVRQVEYTQTVLESVDLTMSVENAATVIYATLRNVDVNVEVSSLTVAQDLASAIVDQDTWMLA